MRTLPLDQAAAGALVTILGIVMDNVQEAQAEGYRTSWNIEHVIDLDARLHDVWPELAGLWTGMGMGMGAASDGSGDGDLPSGEERSVELHIEDAELLLAGAQPADARLDQLL